MPKPADVLKIKQDIKVLQHERAVEEKRIEDLKADQRELEAEIAQLKGTVATWRGVLQTVRDSFAAKVQQGTDKLAEVLLEAAEAQHQVTESRQLLSLVHSSIREARLKQPQDDGTGFFRSVLLHLQQKIAELTGKKEHMSAYLAKLDERKEALEASLQKLEHDKREVGGQVKILFAGIAAGEKKYSEVMTEIAKHQETLGAIEAREHDSRVMQIRLSKEYQEAYAAYKNRHGSLDSKL